MLRLRLQLSHQSEWIKIFDPRDWTVFVATDDVVEPGGTVRIDLDVDGWLVTLRGTIVGTGKTPRGAVVALEGSERDKINYLNGYVRGGVLNHRGKRRLPIRLPVSYGAIEGPASTFTKDLNEEGVFLLTNNPLPERSQIHMLISVPGALQPLSLTGTVSHTILPEDDEPPGMGVVFELDDPQRAALLSIIEDLERQLHAGQLATQIVD